MSGHEKMLRIPTPLYPSTKILIRLTQSRHMIETIKSSFCSCFCLFWFVLFLFSLVLASALLPLSFCSFLVRFVSRFASIHRSFPTPLADSFPISSFPHFLISSSRQPDKPDKVKKTMASTRWQMATNGSDFHGFGGVWRN